VRRPGVPAEAGERALNAQHVGAAVDRLAGGARLGGPADGGGGACVLGAQLRLEGGDARDADAVFGLGARLAHPSGGVAADGPGAVDRVELAEHTSAVLRVLLRPLERVVHHPAQVAVGGGRVALRRIGWPLGLLAARAGACGAVVGSSVMSVTGAVVGVAVPGVAVVVGIAATQRHEVAAVGFGEIFQKTQATDAAHEAGAPLHLLDAKEGRDHLPFRQEQR
jgi:hypothetical protein